MPRNDGEGLRIQLSNSPTASSDLQTCVIAPCSSPAPGHAGHSLFLVPVGACGTTGRETAPAAPVLKIRASRVFAAHGQWSSSLLAEPAADEALRQRSARGWVFQFAPCPKGVTVADADPLCKLLPGHALGPPVRFTVVCPRQPRDLRSVLGTWDPSAFGAGIVAAHRIPLRERRRSRRAPHRSGMDVMCMFLRLPSICQRRNYVKSVHDFVNAETAAVSPRPRSEWWEG
jgi:hypothetical protein